MGLTKQGLAIEQNPDADVFTNYMQYFAAGNTSGFFFEKGHEGYGLSFMDEQSFDITGKVRSEVSAWLVEEGLIVSPWQKNTARKSFNDAFGLYGNNYKVEGVTYRGNNYKILAQVHTHPNTQGYSKQKFGGDINALRTTFSRMDMFIIRRDGGKMYMLPRKSRDPTGIGSNKDFFNGTKSLYYYVK
jgi:hypothetical protein